MAQAVWKSRIRMEKLARTLFRCYWKLESNDGLVKRTLSTENVPSIFKLKRGGKQQNVTEKFFLPQKQQHGRSNERGVSSLSATE